MAGFACFADLNLATVGMFEAGDHSEQRGLAASRGAEQHHKFSAGHFERNVRNASARRESTRQVANGKVGHGRAYRELPAVNAPRKDGPRATTTHSAGTIISNASALAGPTLPKTV